MITYLKGCASLAACALVGSFLFHTASGQASLTGNNWPDYYGDYRGWAYSPLNHINKQNVSKLHVAWIHQPGEITQGLESTPIVVDGKLYYSASNNRVFALEANTGKELWHYYAKLDPIQNKQKLVTDAISRPRRFWRGTC